ncbi:MAG: hypothetical protein WD489_04625 [Rhodovibrionaceae bacterium]
MNGKTRAVPRRAPFLLWLVTPLAAAASPILAFYAFQNYPILSTEGLAFLGLAAAIALLGGCLAWLLGRLGQALLIGASLAFVVDSMIGADVWSYDSLYKVLGAFALGALFGWLLRRHAMSVAAVGFSAVLLSTLLLPPAPYAPLGTFGAAAEGAASLPPVVHVVFDSHIGLAGIPLGIEGGRESKQAIRDFWRKWEFRGFARAYTRYQWTHQSVPKILNPDLPRDAFIGALLGDIRETFPDNSYFAALEDAGYKLNVVQPDFMEYCQPKDSSVARCVTYPYATLAWMADSPLALGDRLTMLLIGLIKKSTILTHLNKYYERLPVLGIEVATIPKAARLYTPLAARQEIEAEAAFIRDAGRGQFHFLHILLPHQPYLYEGDCALKPTGAPWWVHHPTGDAAENTTEESRREEYRRYFEQLRCTVKLMDGFMATILESPDFADAVFFFHADHGSRLSRKSFRATAPEELSLDDILDLHSVIAALRAPGIEPGVEQTQRALDEIFVHEAGPAMGLDLPDGEVLGDRIYQFWLTPEDTNSRIMPEIPIARP